MKLEIIHTGSVVNNKLILDNDDMFRANIESYNGKKVKLTINEIKETRSLQMNKYYWGIVLKSIVDHFNQEQTFNKLIDCEFVHELMKYKLLGTSKYQIPGCEIIEIVNSSAKLTNKEFIDYFENIIAWAAEYLNVTIPYPNEELLWELTKQNDLK